MWKYKGDECVRGFKSNKRKERGRWGKDNKSGSEEIKRCMNVNKSKDSWVYKEELMYGLW